jgi:hypothetical protein
MPKLYRCTKDLEHWYFHNDGMGWVRFPARINGWVDRRPLSTVHGLDLRPVPLWLAFNTGLPAGVRRLHCAA